MCTASLIPASLISGYICRLPESDMIPHSYWLMCGDHRSAAGATPAVLRQLCPAGLQLRAAKLQGEARLAFRKQDFCMMMVHSCIQKRDTLCSLHRAWQFFKTYVSLCGRHLRWRTAFQTWVAGPGMSNRSGVVCMLPRKPLLRWRLDLQCLGLSSRRCCCPQVVFGHLLRRRPLGGQPWPVLALPGGNGFSDLGCVRAA